MAKSNSNSWCVYVLKCRNNYLYIGITNNLEKRLKEHNNGTGSKFVRTWRPFELVKTIPCRDEKEARSLEYRLKQMRREQKISILGLEQEDIKRRWQTKIPVDMKTVNTVLNKAL